MNHRLPPLNSLRAFEAAGRHLSFMKAAHELNVTPAAVGHQIKKLEQHLGMQLFRRLNRGLILTDAGRACLPGLTEGFGTLTSAIETITARDSQAVLTITVAPSFAAKWLIPRLDRFRAVRQDIAVRIDTDLREIDLASAGIDLGIRFGSGQYPGLRVDRLMSEEIIPVCSPALLHGRSALRAFKDLKKFTLLHIEGETKDIGWANWPAWFRAMHCNEVDGETGPRFTQSIMAVQAAIEGQGVALAPSSIVAMDIAEGRLMRLFTDVKGIPTEFAYYIVSPKSVSGNPEVAAFREWMIQEIGQANPEPFSNK